MVIRRGDIWWAELDSPIGSEPGFRRPVLIVQTDWANAGAIQTVLVAMLTSNLRFAIAPGNVLVQARDSGLPKPSVINVSQLAAINKNHLTEHVKRLPSAVLRQVDEGLRLMLDL